MLSYADYVNQQLRQVLLQLTIHQALAFYYTVATNVVTGFFVLIARSMLTKDALFLILRAKLTLRQPLVLSQTKKKPSIRESFGLNLSASGCFSFLTRLKTS
jgi:hypothetical protein